AALESLHEGLLHEVLGQRMVAHAPLDEGQELAVARDQLLQHVVRQACRRPATGVVAVAAHRAGSAPKRRSQSELSRTDTLDSDMAARAYTGDNATPSPAKAPAAIGMPTRL